MQLFFLNGMTHEDYLSLCQEVWEHNWLYFVDNAPTISDQEFDKLFARLVAMEKTHPEWIFPGSPTQRVGEMVQGKFPTVAHATPMLSLANTYSPEEVKEFLERMEKLLGRKGIMTHAELKMDGIALSVRYEKGILVRAVTRGSGDRGEEITAQVRTIQSLPLQLRSPYPALLEARGEVFMPKEAFNALNEACRREGKPLFANPRNAAGGSLKLLDPAQVAKRKLAISFYGIAEISSDGVATQDESLLLLKRLGLPVVGKRLICTHFEEIMHFATQVDKMRRELPFEIDGIVIKVNDLKEQKNWESREKNYRWAIAYKFAAQRVETIIRSITIQVGRTGVLTPVAELDPVEVAGSTISRATLHNADEVKRKDIREGDAVFIEKGGDVIPKVVEVNFARRPQNSHPWKMATHCPACAALVHYSKDEVAVRCPNKLGCPAQELRRLIYFVGKNGMDIDHLGEKVVTQLVDKGFVSKLSDIYTLTKEQLFQLKNFKEKAVDNLLMSIEKSKDVALERLIMALGIQHVGTETAILLANRVGDLSQLAKMTEAELMVIENIGPKVAESILTFFSDPDHLDEIARLLKCGVRPYVKEQISFEGHPFHEKTFVLTGTLTRYTRDAASSLIRERGGKISSTVSKKTDYLLAGSDPGSKYDKALKLGVPIITEEEFSSLL